MPLPLYSASRAIRIPELLRHKHTNNSVLRIMAAVKTACTALCIIFCCDHDLCPLGLWRRYLFICFCTLHNFIVHNPWTWVARNGTWVSPRSSWKSHTTAETVCRGGRKVIFGGGRRNRPCFSQLKMTVCRGGYESLSHPVLKTKPNA